MCLSLLLSACATLSDPQSAQDSSQDVIATINSSSGAGTVGQTFTSRRAGLNGLTLWLAPKDGQGPASLSVELYRLENSSTSGTIQTPIFTGHYTVKSPGPLALSLPTRPDPPGQDYLLRLKTDSVSPIQVLGRKGDVYPGGQAYQGGQPLDADLAFRSTYRYGWQAIIEDGVRAIQDAWLALPLALWLLVPGWLVLDLSGLRRRFDGIEQVALSVGLSLSVTPVLMLWTSLIGLRWNRQGVMFGMGILVGLIVWRTVQPALFIKVRLGGAAHLKNNPNRDEQNVGEGEQSVAPGQANPKSWGINLALVAVFLLSFAVRMAMVRDLAAPAWVDSVHHALITRLILQNGTYPATYAPYLSIDPTKYHAGFHSNLAVLQWISGLDLTQGLLLSGQVLNAMAILTVYLLATTLLRNRTAGLLAALATGLFTPMPAYYASWGRYTQLAGLLILPAALALVRQALPAFGKTPPPGMAPVSTPPGNASPGFRHIASPLMLACLTTAGLLLVHYRDAAFLAALLLPYLFIHWIGLLRARPASRRSDTFAILIVAVGVGLGALLLSLPWIGPNLTRNLPAIIQAGNASPIAAFSDFSWRHLNTGLGKYVTPLAAIGLAWGLLQRRRFALVSILWIAGMFLLANLGALGLPGGWLINNTSVVISLFMPISIAAGYVLSELVGYWDVALPGRARLPYRVGLVFTMTVLALFGARSLLTILNPTTFLFREADRPAIRWIEQNLPAGETILINPFLWGYGVYAGNDGGYWISPLSGHKTLPPPVIYGFGGQSEYYEIEEVSRAAIAQGDNPEELWSLLQSHHIRYVYIGARGGPLSPYALENSSRFLTLYKRGGAWVFEVKVER